MKRVRLNLRIALRSLYNFKLRSVLAILGVFLGTCSLIIVYNLSGSLAKKTQMEIDKLGKDLLIVRTGVVIRHGRGPRLMSQDPNLTFDDVRAIAQGASQVRDVSPSSSTPFPVRYKSMVLDAVLITGVTPNYPEMRNLAVKEGGFITESDNKKHVKVAVLGSGIAEKLFGKDSAIGKYILVRRFPCQVIGVMEERGADLSGVDQDMQIFLPLNTFLRRLVNKDFVNTIYVKCLNSRSIAPAKAEIEAIMRRQHKMKPGKRDDFTVIDLKDVMALQTQAMDTISTLGRVSAIISFLIGGLGILSIMTLMVGERKMEIGVRRAVGSRKRDIVVQFLLESSFISFSGGAAGVVVGFAGTVIILQAFNLPFNVSSPGLAISFFASVAVGLTGGIYPAKKATSIQPVNILRH
ncbi:MAG: hypothetical protein BA872_03525 [Desulfobacterales bacterium C00003060]|nr:MAG: hypothetical protein BA861_09775 [Desulfobacterales bacterium S3730MH5]OEU80829.1 MAG: hypothetical protein BA872_03525 [Desulfobacterales bacterium C00003060]